MKVTRVELEAKIEYLGRQLGRDLYLETWSPGDGWTRYKVVDRDTGTEVLGNHRVFTRQEIAAALSSACNVLDLVHHRPIKYQIVIDDWGDDGGRLYTCAELHETVRDLRELGPEWANVSIMPSGDRWVSKISGQYQVVARLAVDNGEDN